MDNENLARHIIDLRVMMEKYELEISYLEGLLVSTSGPADETIAELDRHRLALQNLRHEYSYTFDKIAELKESEKN